MNFSRRYLVLNKAREIAKAPNLDILEIRKYLGVPLANDLRQWLAEQAPNRPLCIDFSGVRAVNLSVAEELGPLLMQAVQQSPDLEQRFPIYQLSSPEPEYTFYRSFANANWTAMAILDKADESLTFPFVLQKEGKQAITVLGELSPQMQHILRLADERCSAGKPLTSDDLRLLDFLRNVSPAARSKRLTELYARRLLAFRDNPLNPRERLFFPAWRLESDEQCSAA